MGIIFDLVAPKYVTALLTDICEIDVCVANVQTIMNTLQSLNIPFETGTFEGFEHHHYHWVEWRDPDGIRLECIELID